MYSSLVPVLPDWLQPGICRAAVFTFECWQHAIAVARTHSSNALGPALDLDWVPTDYRRFAVFTAQGTPEPTARGAIENFEGELERLNRKAKGTESVADRLGLNVEGRVQ